MAQSQFLRRSSDGSDVLDCFEHCVCATKRTGVHDWGPECSKFLFKLF